MNLSSEVETLNCGYAPDYEYMRFNDHMHTVTYAYDLSPDKEFEDWLEYSYSKFVVIKAGPLLFKVKFLDEDEYNMLKFFVECRYER